jgi:hypothetical protein
MSFVKVFTDDTAEQVLRMIAQTLSGYRKPLERTDHDFWLRALGVEFKPSDIELALIEHTRESRLAPRPADIVARLKAKKGSTGLRDGMPGKQPEIDTEALADIRARSLWVARLFLGGDPYENVDPVVAERWINELNVCAKSAGTPEFVPEQIWLDSIWGGPRESVIKQVIRNEDCRNHQRSV